MAHIQKSPSDITPEAEIEKYQRVWKFTVKYKALTFIWLLVASSNYPIHQLQVTWDFQHLMYVEVNKMKF